MLVIKRRNPVGVEYARADEVAHIADGLIPTNHPHLVPVRIEYVWRDKAASKGDRVTLGKARKVSGLNAFLAREDPDSDACEDFFVLEIARDTWEGMNSKQREALVDHELAHMGLTEDGKLTTVPHDIEEFHAILKRHGAWKSDLAVFVEIGKGIARLPLDPVEADIGTRVDEALGGAGG